MGALEISVVSGCRPLTMRLDLDDARPNEATILGYIKGGRLYEPDVAGIFARVLREGDTVIDIGANAGFFTVLAAALVGPTGRVVSFEPDPGNVLRLRQNLALNGYDHVSVIAQPSLATAGTVNFYLNSDNSGGSALWGPGHNPKNIRSQAAPRVLSMVGTTIDAEVARLGLSSVRLVKVDTEGAEHEVLRGAANLLAGAAVPFVVAELNELALTQIGSSHEALRGYMEHHGYDTFMLYHDGTLPRLMPRETVITTQYVSNMLFSRPDVVGACWPACFHHPGPM